MGSDDESVPPVGESALAVNESDLDWHDRDREAYAARRKQLGGATDGRRLGCSLYELPAEQRAWPYHYHAGNEEALYVLAGSGHLRLAGDRYALEAGDYVAFPEGEDGAHQVINPGGDVLRYLMVSTMDDPEVLSYPDSGKVGALAGAPPGGDGERDVQAYFEAEDAVGYWEGE